MKTVERNEGTFTFRGALSIVVADNLAAHAIGGFFESFTAIHPCRFCIIRKDKMCSSFTSDPDIVRTSESYDSQLALISRDESFSQCMV